MRANDVIIFIDSKGVSHNALVKSFRQHMDASNELVDQEPLVTLTYHKPPTDEPTELIDVPHMGHPSRQESNPDLPTYALHVWKFEDEEHLELPPDHPVHDHPFESAKFDDDGKVIPKHRPIYEKHIQWHKAAKAGVTLGPTTTGVMAPKPIPVQGADLPRDVGPRWKTCPIDGDFLVKDDVSAQPYCRTCRDKAVPIGHPAHPQTVGFPFTCQGCGALVKRIASHQGGRQWEPVDGAQKEGAVLGGDNSHLWQEHVCDPATAKAYAESLKKKPEPVKPEPTASERLAAGEQLAPEPEAETETEEEMDVIAELENAPPAPREPEPPADEVA